MTKNNGELWNQIKRSSNENILAFEHHTLTSSVFENVALLTSQLPDKIKLDVLSHSRGGLVLDTLIMVIEASRNEKLRKTIKLSLEENNKVEDTEFFLSALSNIETKDISINRIIKVACPGNGTMLLSKNIILFFRSLLAIIKYTSVGSGPVINTLEKMLIRAIQTKDNPDILPGIEAMTPDSIFTQILNSVKMPSNIDCSVLAGDAQLSPNIWHSLKFIITRLIHWKTMIL